MLPYHTDRENIQTWLSSRFRVHCALRVLQPVYGLIQAKLEMITHAYFQGRDFSQVTLLEDTHKTLNLSLNESLLNDSQVFVGQYTFIDHV